MNHPPIILDLCGGTGAWSQPYTEAGYDVRLITLPAHNVCTYQPPEHVHGILAAPPCTMFSIARRTAKTPPDFEGGMKPVIGCLRIIWQCRVNDSLKWWALENPRGLLRQFLGKPPLTFQPFWYGDPWTKATDLWGYYQPPRKHFTQLAKHHQWESFKSVGELTRTQVRAITPPAFAKAFFEANP